VRGLAGVGLFALLLPAATPFEGAPSPTTIARSFRAEVRVGQTIQTVAWKAPESLAVRSRGPMAPFGSEIVVERGGVRVLLASPGSRRSDLVIVERRLFAARPDGYSLIQDMLQGPTDFVLEQARAGKLKLRLTRSGRRLALRAKVRLYPNDCAALRGGTAELWLDRATLLPLRLRVRRGSFRSDSRTILRGVNVPLTPRAFRPPRSNRQREVVDYGFVRTSPRRAARPLSYRARFHPASAWPWPAGRAAPDPRGPKARTRSTGSSSAPSTGAASSGSTSRSASPAAGDG
jgi:hypothetical protein